jgi:hypothetical protein
MTRHAVARNVITLVPLSEILSTSLSAPQNYHATRAVCLDGSDLISRRTVFVSFGFLASRRGPGGASPRY